jgi:sugar transferase (PEP-CTERM/EpsH1 system associated)
MSNRPELLFLAHRIPYPPNKGDKIRAHAMLMHLTPRYRVHLACNVDDPADMAHAPLLQDLLGGECLFVPLHRGRALARAAAAAASGRSLSEGYFGAPAIGRWLARLARRRKIARTIVFGSAMAPFVLDEPALDAGTAIVDLVDVDSDKWAQYARDCAPPKRWLYAYEAGRVAALERRAAARFGHTVLVSPHEAETFARLAPESAARITSISNGVDLEHFAPDRFWPNPFPPGVTPVVMTGLMDYWPNIQAAEWFADEVLPLILRHAPDLHFAIVGANPPDSLRRRAGAHLTVTGRVEDVRPYLAHAAVAVAPLRIARGVQNKVLEAMAMGRPVVASEPAARALAAAPGRDLLVEEEPQRFAAAVLRALDPATGDALGRAGRAYVEHHHRWAATLSRLDALLGSGERKPPPPARFLGPLEAKVAHVE